MGAQASLLALAAALPALLLAALGPLGRAAPAAAVLGAVAAHGFVWVDRLAFAILGRHLDRTLLGIALAPGGLAALEVQAGEWARIAAGAGLLAALLALAFAALLRRAGARALGGGRGRGPEGGALRAAGAVAVLLFAGERVAYGAGSLLGWRAPVRAEAALPLHGLEEGLHVRDAPGRLRYPRAPLRFAKVEAPPSLLFIVVESWRPDVLTAENMPATWRWSRGATRFLDHRSGGNWTPDGVFTLFYGLPATYRALVEEARRGPVLVDRALALGYEVKVLASRGAKFPRHERSTFAAIPRGALEDDLPGADSAEKDRALLARARAFLAGRDPARPFLLALFLDATHLPYAYGPASARYQPATDHLYYQEMSTPLPREPIWNRYRNAVAEVDGTIGGVLEALAAAGLAARTAVVLTGDHGQEFYEHGALGHNIALDAEQTAVPLVLSLPGLPPGDVTGRTRHVDVVPTLLERLGALSPPEDYATGRPLPGAAGPAPALLCGLQDCAVLDGDGYTTVFRPGDPRRPLEVRDPQWRVVAGRRPSAGLAQARRDLAAFLE